MDLKTQKKWHPAMLVYLITALFYFWLAAQVPYTGDDWDWGLDIGLQHLLTADINSRYAGNFLVVIMTRSELAKTLIMGACYFAIPFLMTAIVVRGDFRGNWKKSTILFLACNCLLLSMDSLIWQQTYGWVSGFANYGVSAVLILLYLYQILPLFAESVSFKKSSPAGVVGMFLLGVVIQLFLENLAVLMVLLAGAVCLIGYLREKKVRGNHLAMLLGTLVGIVIMFSSAIYPVLFDTGKTLGNGRELTFDQSGGLLGMAASCFTVFAKEVATLIWEKNVVLCCAISVLLVLLWLRREDGKYPKLGMALTVIDLLSIPYFVIFSHYEYGKYFLLRYGLLDLFELAVNVGYFLVVALQVVLLFRERKWHMGKLLMLWICAPVVIAPLTAVVLDGSRFYLTSNVFMIQFAALLLDAYIADLPEKTGRMVLALGLSAVMTFCMYYFFIYREISICTQTRLETIAQARETGERDIVLPAYPYTVMDYVWVGEPPEEFRVEWFKEFHGIPEDANVTFVYE